MPRGKAVVEKDLQVKEFGDSLYIPLTRFFRRIGIRKNQVVHVILNEGGEIIITNPDTEPKR